MSRLEKRLLHHVGRAVFDFDLIARDDRILVAVSGGKDSLALLVLLMRLRERSPVPFTLTAVTVDQGQPGFCADPIEAFFKERGVDYRIVRQDTWAVVQRLTRKGKSPCPVCARLRRGILYTTAAGLGADKIALGHHREDLIETLLLSAFFSGALKSMPARLVSDDGRNTVIRPLAYCPEAELRQFALEEGLPTVPAGLCQQPNQQRRRIKELVAALAREHPAVPGNLLNALRHVVPSHLLDRSLRRGGEEEGAGEDREE